MSRVGKEPIAIPKGVEVKLEGDLIKVKGPKGSIERRTHANVKVVVEGEEIKVERPDNLPQNRALHGTTRMMIANMIKGVTDGFMKELEIHGIGYRAELQGKNLSLSVSKSHPVVYEPRKGITIELPEVGRGVDVRIRVSGIDKEMVGQAAAEIRSVDPPEPYKGKGIRYVGEYVRRKAGKTGAAQG
jgi:large subunit ribosomal protein L6